MRALVEISGRWQESFSAFEACSVSREEAVRSSSRMLESLGGAAIDVGSDAVPVPMLAADQLAGPLRAALARFAVPEESPDLPASTVVVPVDVSRDRLDDLAARPGVRVWENSDIVLLGAGAPGGAQGGSTDPKALGLSSPPLTHADARDREGPSAGVDCRPFRRGVDLAEIRALLGVEHVWAEGHRGQGVTVGVLDDGIDGSVYPVAGGFSRPGAAAPGSAPITSHGSMCAAGVLVAAPSAQLHDYPFLGIPNSGGALAMFQAVLDDRRRAGLPHLTTNSWGFVAVPPREQAPRHEVHDLNHPLHRKVREVVAAGVATLFAAGNCGEDCPSGVCHASSVGPGRSIHGANSLAEVIAVAAVNSRHERIGYSSQGPGMFEPVKPDLAAYSHYFGNFGPGRPGGRSQPFDSGTSAAAPLAAGVAALLLGAFRDLEPEDLREALVAGATRPGTQAWDPGYGHGIVNAAASYTRLRQDRGDAPAPPG